MARPNDLDVILMNPVNHSFYQAYLRFFKIATTNKFSSLLVYLIRYATSCWALYICLISSLSIYLYSPNTKHLILQICLHLWHLNIQYKNCKSNFYYYPLYLSSIGSIGFLVGNNLNEQWILLLSWIFLISAALCTFIFKHGLADRMEFQLKKQFNKS